MPRDIQIDRVSADIVIGPDGNVALIDGAEAVAQQLRITLNRGRGEVYMAPSVGLDWLSYAQLPPELIAGDVRGVCDSVPGVTEVDAVAERRGSEAIVTVTATVDLVDRDQRLSVTEQVTISIG